MATLIVCIKRNAALSRQEFLEHWQASHGPLLGRCDDFTRHLVRYTQYAPDSKDSAVSRLFGNSGDFDGVAVLEFRDAAAMERAFSEPAYLSDVQPDEGRFVDAENCLSFVVDPLVVFRNEGPLDVDH